MRNDILTELNLDEEEKKYCDRKVWTTELTERVLDNNGHIFVKHDLYNHDGKTHDGIAEAFIEFAKKEGLSFFR